MQVWIIFDTQMRINLVFTVYVVSTLSHFASTEYIWVDIRLGRLFDPRPQDIQRNAVSYVPRGTVQSHHKNVIGQESLT